MEYPPEFYLGANGAVITKNIKHGENVSLNCESHENPAGSVKWFYSVDESNKRLLQEESKILKFQKMKNFNKGFYQCVVENSMGNATKYFTVKNVPNGKLIKNTRMILI